MWIAAFSRGVLPVSVGGAVEIVEIFRDRGAFGNHEAIVEHEHRRLADRVHRQKRRLLLFGGAQIDADELDLIVQALFGEHDADARGVRRAFAIVEFHLRHDLSLPR